MIRAKVRLNPKYLDFNPRWTLSFYSWILVGSFMMSVWMALYYANKSQLHHLHGPYSAIVGLLVGPVLQCKLVLPKSVSRKEFWQVAIIAVASTCVIIIGQAIIYCFLLALLTWVNKSFMALVIIPFICIKLGFNWVVAFIARWTDSKPLRIIFINNNAMIQRMILCWALSSKLQPLPIIFVGLVDLLQTLFHIFFVLGPLQVHKSASINLPFMLFYWMLGTEWSGMEPLTKEERLWAIAERAKWLYYTVLQNMGELIMPYWQIVFFYLNSSSKRNRSAFMGFDKVKNGFPVIEPLSLTIVAAIMAGVDIVNILSFTFSVRRKYPHFNPFKLLNVLIKKFNWVLAYSVLSVVLSVQCMMLIDCKFDIDMDHILTYFK